MRYLIILIAVILVSCQSKEQHGHAHDEQGNHTNNETERPTIDKTIWTSKCELFVEFPVLVIGNTSRFAAHFTILEKHLPVLSGSVTVSLVKNGKAIRQTAENPSSPGIFKPSLIPKEAGIYQLVFELVTPTISDKIVIENVQVFASIEEATIALAESVEDDNKITFLKEQAWKIEFQTDPVVEGEIYDVVPTSGIWKVSTADYQTLVATTNGVVIFNKIITDGLKVKKGEVLMLISSSELTSDNLDSEILKSKSKYEQAKAEYDRKKQLYASNIVSKAEFEQVEYTFQVAKSTYETLIAGYSVEGKKLFVPSDGYVKSISVENGDFVEQGDALLKITSHRSSILESHVSTLFSSQIQNIHDIWYQPNSDKWSSLSKTGGKIISVGKVVDKDNPLLSINALVNEVIDMPEGGYTEVQITIGDPIEVTKIPTSALLEDYGNYSVIVQLSGESFERRQITIGKRNGNEVEVKTGLQVGEVVVTKGAYQVKMASMSGVAPAHGHDH